MPQTKIDSRILLACLLLSFVFGSVHGFSVFIEPMENAFLASRSSVSLTYSIALMSLTAAVLTGHHFFGLLSIRLFAVSVIILASIGLLIAAISNNLYGAWLGYGLIFGFANGLGYAFALQLPAQRIPQRKGVLMGYVTAAYSVGACLSPWLLEFGISHNGVAGGFIALSLTLLLFVPAMFYVIPKNVSRFESAPIATISTSIAPQTRKLVFLWLGYGTAVAAGLMAIGHATGIAKEAGIPAAQLILAPALLTISGIPGSLLSGWLADRVPARLLVAVFPLASAIVLYFLSITENWTVLPLLAIVGLLYGMIIVAYPVAISTIFGVTDGVRAYGKVFTAWGTAGLAGPWLAGYFFDLQASYQIALWVAAGLALMSMVIIIMATSLGLLNAHGADVER